MVSYRCRMIFNHVKRVFVHDSPGFLFRLNACYANLKDFVAGVAMGKLSDRFRILYRFKLSLKKIFVCVAITEYMQTFKAKD